MAINKFLDATNKASGPLTVLDWIFRIWAIVSVAGAGVIAWLVWYWDLYWQKFSWAGIAIGLVVLLFFIAVIFLLFTIGHYLLWLTKPVTPANASAGSSGYNHASEDKLDSAKDSLLNEEMLHRLDSITGILLDLRKKVPEIEKRIGGVEERLEPRTGLLQIGESGGPSRLGQIETRLLDLEGKARVMLDTHQIALTFARLEVQDLVGRASALEHKVYQFSMSPNSIDLNEFNKLASDWQKIMHYMRQLLTIRDEQFAYQLTFAPQMEEMTSEGLAAHGRHLPDALVTNPPLAGGPRGLSPRDLYILRCMYLQAVQFTHAKGQISQFFDQPI